MSLKDLNNLKYQDCLKLLKEDLELYKEVESLYFKYEQDIINKGIEEIFQDNNIVNLINAYIEITKKNIINLAFDRVLLDDSLSSYLQEISKYKNLDYTEEKRLFTEYKNGSKEARKILIESNLKLVVFLAKRYSYDNTNFLDIIEEGNLGLIEAIKNFDIDKGYKFSTYAYYWIKRNILSYLNEKVKNIKFNHSISSEYIKYLKEKDKLIQKYQRKLSNKELSELLKIPLVKIDFFEKIPTFETISIDDNIYEDDEISLINIIQDKSVSVEDLVIDNESNSKIKNYILNCKLSTRQKDILLKRYGFENDKIYTGKELGEIYGVQRQRISQLEKIAIDKLKQDPEFNALCNQIEYKVMPLSFYFQDYPLYSIKIAVKYLRKKDQEFLNNFYLKYKVNQDNYCSKYDIDTFNSIIIKLIDILDKYYKSNRYHMKTIFELFPSYSKEEILNVIEKLNKDDKQILFYRYGNDLDNITDIYWKDEYKDLFYKHLLNVIRKRLERAPKYNYHVKTIYELFSKYERSDIDNLISIMNNEDKQLLYLRYGNDLDDPNTINWSKEYNSKFYGSLIPYMKRCLKDKKYYPRSKIKTLMEILNTSLENVKIIIDSLNDKDKHLIYLRYGNDLEHPTDINWNIEYSDDLYNCLIPKMKKKLQTITLKNQIKIKTIYSYFEEYEEDLIDYIIFNLDDSSKKLLILRYGYDLNNPVKNPLWENNTYHSKFYDCLIPKIKRLLEEYKTNNIDNSSSYNYLKIYNFIDENEYLKNNYTINEGFIITLRYGLCDNIVLDSEEIANKLKIDIKVVKKVAKKALLLSKELFEKNYQLVLEK